MKQTSNKWVLVSLSLSTLMASLGVSIANIALPTLTIEFSTTFQSVQWVVISYLLSITVMIVSIGRFGDIYGLRKILLFGVVIYTLSSFLCGISPTLWSLVLSRALQGFGAAILIVITLAFVRNVISEKKIGSAMGMLGTMSAIGTALGPTLGGLLIQNLGWRFIFYIMIPLGVFNFFLIKKYLPKTKIQSNPEDKKNDWIGIILLIITLSSYTMAMTIGKGNFNWLNLTLILLAGIGGVIFIYSQNKIKKPLIELSILENKNLKIGLLVNSLVSTVMMTTLVVGPFFLSFALGLNETYVGIVMSFGPIISAITGVPSGKLVDRFGSKLIIRVGLLIMVIGAFLLSILPIQIGVFGYIISLSILTPGYQLFQAANNTSVMMDANKNQQGVISGILNLSRNLGLITGASAMGALFAYAVGTSNFKEADIHNISKGMSFTFIIAGILISFGWIISILKTKHKS
ncbi:MFS transporter [Flavobacterium sp. J27]|uniref:MFS transporter n=1 Tax=Flavobacterium sp. J27 TaxID=2060419 RepID=UPI0010325BC7|nr:MFS transporter [Flavobacterium sp. J27]